MRKAKHMFVQTNEPNFMQKYMGKISTVQDDREVRLEEGQDGSCPGIPEEDPETTPRFLAWASSSEEEQVRAFLPDKKFKMRLISLKIINLETKDSVRDSGASSFSN